MSKELETLKQIAEETRRLGLSGHCSDNPCTCMQEVAALDFAIAALSQPVAQDAKLDSVLASLEESARCLGCAQESHDPDAAAYWTAQVATYRAELRQHFASRQSAASATHIDREAVQAGHAWLDAKSTGRPQVLPAVPGNLAARYAFTSPEPKSAPAEICQNCGEAAPGCKGEYASDEECAWKEAPAEGEKPDYDLAAWIDLNSFLSYGPDDDDSSRKVRVIPVDAMYHFLSGKRIVPADASKGGEQVPTEPGLYAWVPSDGAASLVLVNKRPSAHSPGGVLNGHCIRPSEFYDGAPVSEWGKDGRWVLLRSLALNQGSASKEASGG